MDPRVVEFLANNKYIAHSGTRDPINSGAVLETYRFGALDGCLHPALLAQAFLNAGLGLFDLTFTIKQHSAYSPMEMTGELTRVVVLPLSLV